MAKKRGPNNGIINSHSASVNKEARFAGIKSKKTNFKLSKAMVSATPKREYFYEDHPELSVKSIGDATSSAKMKPELCDVASHDGDTLVWFWKPNKGEESITAVFHYDIRLTLIEIASTKGSYAHEPERGTGDADVTAFYEPHTNWQEDRNNRPDVLRKFAAPEDYLNTESDVGFLHFKGHVVIDIHHNALKAYNMPLTFAPNVEGWRLEAIRRTDARINLKDIEARLPVAIIETPMKALSYKPCCDENALAARARRFRERNGAISWCKRDGSIPIRKFMESLLSQDAKDTNAALNRELTKAELAQLRLLNFGKHPERARKAGRSATEAREVRNNYHSQSQYATHQMVDDSQDAFVLYDEIAGNFYDNGAAMYQTPSKSPDGPFNTVDYFNNSAEHLFANTEPSASPANLNSVDNSGMKDIEKDIDNEIQNTEGILEDSRFTIPMNAYESNELDQALSPTVSEYARLTGLPEYPNTGYGSYMTQYNKIQDHFEFKTWPKSQGPAPKLPIRDAWTGGIAKWKDSEISYPALIDNSAVVIAENDEYFHHRG